MKLKITLKSYLREAMSVFSIKTERISYFDYNDVMAELAA
jgi:hypothetical protein